MKKKGFGYLIITLLLIACTGATNKANDKRINSTDDFVITLDTFHVNIKGNLTHALKYRDKYYVLFEEVTVNNYGGYNKRWLVIFSKGDIEKKVDLPKELEVNYLDFFVHNDSIILKPYMDESIYCFDSHDYIWKKISKAEDLIFEDEKYWVYSRDFGEWGGKTWFKDKVTGLEYEIEATKPLVNKIGPSYYFTNGIQILKIEDPLLLNKCTGDITYENIEASKKCYSWYGNATGFQVIYKDTTYNQFDFSYHPGIVSSFVWKNKLLHIYETEKATYIAKIENNAIKPIQKVAKELRFFGASDSYRCKNLNGTNELLKFEIKEKQLCGLFDIVDNKIEIHYITNNAELYPKLFASSKANDIFDQRLNLILTNLPNLQLKRVEQEEKHWNSYENTPNHSVGIGDSWNPKKYSIDIFKSFLIKEDSLISYTTEYFATKKNRLVRAVIFEWHDDTDLFKSQLHERARKAFKTKLSFLERCITQKAGNHIKFINEEGYTEKTWKTHNGLTIELEKMKDINEISLIIYQH